MMRPKMSACNRSTRQCRYKVVAPPDHELGLQGYEYDVILTIASFVSPPSGLLSDLRECLRDSLADFFSDADIIVKSVQSPLLQQVVNE